MGPSAEHQASTSRVPRARPLGRAIDWIHGRVLIPAFESQLKGRRTFDYWQELERSQWLPTADIEALQLARLRQILTHAATTCPYYRDTWRDAGLDPATVTDLESFRRWPITGKATRRLHRREIRSRAPGLKHLSKATSGSTGEPSAIDYDDGSFQRRVAATFRGYAWAEAAPGVKQFYYWGIPLAAQSLRERVRDSVYHGLYRRDIHSCLSVRESDAAVLLGKYERSKSAVVVAYAGPLYEWARALSARGLKPTPPSAIVVGAEKLHEFQRTVIQDVFAAPVFETYGSREFMLIGAECTHHAGLHLSAEHLLVEIVDEAGAPVGPGVEGRVLVTDFFNLGAPYIRFEIGDRAVMSNRTCECGRGLPLLERVVGRQLEVVITPDGRRVAGELFPHLFKDHLEVSRFRVTQASANAISIRVQLRDRWPDEARAAALRAIRALVGSQMIVEIDVVDSVELGPGGKLGVVQNPWLAAARAQERDAGPRS